MISGHESIVIYAILTIVNYCLLIIVDFIVYGHPLLVLVGTRWAPVGWYSLEGRWEVRMHVHCVPQGGGRMQGDLLTFG